MLYKNPRPHPLTPSPPGEGELNLLLPSPGGRGVGGEGKNLSTKGVSRQVDTNAQCPMPNAQ
ncbi:hypothetical protein [Tolypothrix sp. FACHB-123]|uniref:hypothetical protein n=1 Tax=Tolypothrix sp. FACHB-123 TaxID=2692868 RepID=UPI0016828F00|nr:hypothetical protein [Tolypothrix sp. FACHB-123]